MLKTEMKKIFAVIFCLGAFSLVDQVYASDNDVDELIERAEEKADNHEEEKALEIFKKVLEEDSENYEALWNKSLLTTRKYHRKDDEDVKLEGYKHALEIADKVVDLYPDKGHSHYVYAVASGRYNNLEGTRDMIEASHDIKEHIEKASELIPDYAPVWHLYGVWHSDIATASSTEETAAGMVSEGLPDDAEEDKAEKYLKKSIDMMSESILFRVDLAKHYIEIDKKDEAIEVLNEAASMEPKMMGDDDKREEAKELLSDIS